MDGSKIIGEQVNHKILGDGEIVAFDHGQDNSYITVKFKNHNNVSRFQFPQIFTELKMLSSSSVLVCNAISMQPFCELCGKSSNKLRIVSDKKVCPECAKTAVKCDNCNKTIFPNEIALEYSTMYGEKKHICKDCAKKYKTCNYCGDIYNVESRIASFPKIPKNIDLCANCVDSVAVSCCECGNQYLENDVITLFNRDYMCRECAKKNNRTCTRCGEPFIVFPSRESTDLCDGCLEKKKHGELILEYKGYTSKKFSSECFIKYMNWTDYKNTKSVPLMTELRKKNGILLIKLDMNYDHSGHYMIVVYDLPVRVRSMWNGRFTASSLKSANIFELIGIAKDMQNDIIQSLTLEGNCAEIWGSPIRLDAVTTYDMDYRKEWRGGYLDYQGNEYGDTTDFYIIGILTIK